MIDSATTTPPRASRLMSQDEIELHKRNGLKMIQDGKSLADVKAYMDAAGVPHKTTVDFSPGITPQYIMGAVTSALHGATFGWDDEALGSLYGLATGSGAQAGRDVYRARLQQFHDQNPGTDLALQMAGGVAGAGKFGALAKGIMKAPTAIEWLANLPGAVKALGSAAAGGALYAAGDQPGGVGDRAAAGAAGAATGAIMGGALTGAAVAAGQIIKPVVKALPVVKKAFASAADQADDVIARDLAMDGAKIPDMIAKVKQNALRGQPSTLMDVAGENTLARASGIQSIPGVGKQTMKSALVERAQDAGDRIVSWLAGKSKLGLANVEKVRDGLLGARALQAETLYDDAYQQAAPLTDKLKGLLREEPFRRAWNEARVMLREAKGLDIGPLSSPAPKAPFFPPATGAVKAPSEVFPPDLPVAGLDYTKRYLDKIVRSGFGSESGWDRGRAHYINQRLKDALEEIDDLVPQYGLARKTYRGDSEVIDALDEGRKFLTTSADKIQLGMAGKSQAETEAYKLGAIESIRDAIYGKHAKVPDVATTVLGGKEMERRIQTLLGSDAKEFLDRVRTEARFIETLRGVASGSRTTPLAKVIEDWEQQSAGVMGNLLAGRPGLALVTAARAGGLKLKDTHQEQVAAEMASRYTKGLDDPAELIGYLLNLESRRPRPSRVPAFAAAIGGQTVAGQQ